MELTLEILLYFIRHLNPVIYRIHSNNTYVGIKQFYVEDQDISADYLYVCDLAYAWENRSFIPEYITMVMPDNDFIFGKYMDEIPGNIVLVDGSCKVPLILNSMISIFGKLANWDKMMHILALEGKCLQELVDISEDILEYPIIVFDSSFDVIAYSHNKTVSNKAFSQTSQQGYTDSDIMNAVKKNKILHLLKSGEPLVAPAASDASKYNVYLNFASNQKNLGYACIFCEESKPKQGYLDILKYFMENIGFCMKRDYEQQRYGQMMYEAFLVNLMNPSTISKEQMEEQLKNIGNIKSHGRFVLGIFEFVGEENIPLDYIARAFERDWWDVKVFIYEKQICLLRVLNEKIEDPVLVENEIHKMKKHLSNYNFYFGISNVFHDLMDLRYAYIQAKVAMKYGKKEHKQFPMYADYYYHHMFSLLENVMPLESIQSEIYMQIKAYDTLNKTNYLKILLQYYENDCNATHTAQKMYIHRNTVRNAIQFIEDHWKINIADIEEKKKIVISHLIDGYKK